MALQVCLRARSAQDKGPPGRHNSETWVHLLTKDSEHCQSESQCSGTGHSEEPTSQVTNPAKAVFPHLQNGRPPELAVLDCWGHRDKETPQSTRWGFNDDGCYHRPLLHGPLTPTEIQSN